MENHMLETTPIPEPPENSDFQGITLSIALFNDLITVNQGIVKVYHTAVPYLENESNVQLLQEYARQHEQFVAELSHVLVGWGVEPTANGVGSGLVKQVWVTLKAVFTAGDGPVLAEVAQDAQMVLAAYSEAMAANMPENARDVIRRHMSYSRLAYEKLSSLSAVYQVRHL